MARTATTTDRGIKHMNERTRTSLTWSFRSLALAGIGSLLLAGTGAPGPLAVASLPAAAPQSMPAPTSTPTTKPPSPPSTRQTSTPPTKPASAPATKPTSKPTAKPTPKPTPPTVVIGEAPAKGGLAARVAQATKLVDPASLPITNCATTLPGAICTFDLWANAGTVSLASAPGLTAPLPIWGFSTSSTGPFLVPGPTLIARRGQQVRI